MEAFAKRRSERAISSAPLKTAEISNLLWAANGINRKDGRRTAPTAMNRQELSLYVMIPEGTLRYESAENKLVQISTERPGDAPLMVVK